ncbi:MAG: hypothetical protein IKL10_11310 [Clostridia bacterium]|nr:hypothetical protein [Clostridia bacterium]
MMDFNKIILGEDELKDFENLLMREKLIDFVHEDLSNLISFNEKYSNAKSKKIINKKKLLIFLMLFEKFDATNLSTYDLTRLIELGIVDKDFCIVNGTDKEHPTSKMVDNMLRSNRIVMSIALKAADLIFKACGIIIYSKNFISEESLLTLCNCYWLGTKNDFYQEFVRILNIILNNYYKNQYDKEIIYGFEISIPPDVMQKLWVLAYDTLDLIYKKVDKHCDYADITMYKLFTDKLEGHIQTYNVPKHCMTCDTSWKKCCRNSEFLFNFNFQCPERENLGVQRYAKLNGLIVSQEEHATLFDNSLKFKSKEIEYSKLIEDVYYIVNVDMSKVVANLPIPQTVDEALRLRNRSEIQSFRTIFLKWANHLYNGEIDEAEYIKKDFDAANKYFEKKQVSQNKHKSLWRCTFEAAGNQIPYISNLLGAVSPFINRHGILEEEKHKWLLLTR